jgi:GNAT superfamily N-acetyltransferase
MSAPSPAPASAQEQRPGCRPVIRPAGPGDRDQIARFLDSLSLQTRHRRFLSGARPPASWLPVLSGEREGTDVVVAVAGDAIVGHAMAAYYPAGAGPPDVAIVVADRHQGHGLGRALMAELARRLARRGVHAITVYVLAENRRVLAMISQWCPEARWDWSDRTEATVTVPLRRGRRGSAGPGPPRTAA